MTWKVKKLLKSMPKLNDPVLVEGLPGIGNVGKVAVDFMIEELNAKKLIEFSSFSLPHTVFVTEDNLVELPSIEVYYKKFKGKKRDILFLSGDIQPTDEVSSYEFSYALLDLLRELKSKEIITLGGIGLPTIPEKPKVFCTGTSKEVIKKYTTGVRATNKLYGIVGPIVGVTGLLIGLAKEKKMKGICLLAETYSHPLYLGMKGSEEILKILQKKLNLKLNLNSLHKEVKEIEEELMKRTDQLASIVKTDKKEQTSYIG